MTSRERKKLCVWLWPIGLAVGNIILLAAHDVDSLNPATWAPDWGNFFCGYYSIFAGAKGQIYAVWFLAALVASCLAWLHRPNRLTFALTIICGWGLMGHPGIYIIALATFGAR